MTKIKTLQLVFSFGLLLAGSTCFGQMYTVRDIGALTGNAYSQGMAINASGQVAFTSTNDQYQCSSACKAFLYSKGVVQNLGSLPPSTNSWAYALNDSGHVVGISGHSFLFDGAMHDLGQGEATGINSAGQVVGYSGSVPRGISMFLYYNGARHELGSPSSNRGDLVTTGINASAQVTGCALFPGETQYHAFLYTPGKGFHNLGVPGNDVSSCGMGINDLGEVVGYSAGADDSWHAWFYKDGTLQIVDDHSLAMAKAINNREQIVGFEMGRAFLFDRSTTTISMLGSLIAPSSEFTALIVANGINDSGQITGLGRTRTGQLHAFLMTPRYKAFVQPPINPAGNSVMKVARRVLPVKFTLKQDGARTCNLPPATISVTRTAGARPGAIDESIYSTTADSGSKFRVDASACQYVFNLAASSLGVGKYRVGISINGIQIGNAVFALSR